MKKKMGLIWMKTMSNSKAIIDWLTFSLPVYPQLDMYEIAMGTTVKFVPELEGVLASSDWLETSGRAPYDRSYSKPGWRIFVGANCPHMSIEISGVGCSELRKLALLDVVVGRVCERVSRVDLALDIETDISPSGFVGAGYSKRIRSVGSVSSDSGETVYIGSQKSDRYCRVYKYNKPHPRSGLLRIEYVFRRTEAKNVCSVISKEGVNKSVKKAHGIYKWKHEVMDGLVDSSGIATDVAHRTHSKTLRWLMVQVAPAFRKLVNEGVIEEPEQFFYKYFMGVESDEG